MHIELIREGGSETIPPFFVDKNSAVHYIVGNIKLCE